MIAQKRNKTFSIRLRECFQFTVAQLDPPLMKSIDSENEKYYQKLLAGFNSSICKLKRLIV